LQKTRIFQEARCTGSHLASKSSNQVAFATLENRPSAFNFEQSPILQDFVTATDLKITFNRLSEDQVIICCWEFGWKHYEHK
jgi:netrin receptor unc-5